MALSFELRPTWTNPNTSPELPPPARPVLNQTPWRWAWTDAGSGSFGGAGGFAHGFTLSRATVPRGFISVVRAPSRERRLSRGPVDPETQWVRPHARGHWRR